ncbi:hypothetical protein [Rhodohalobacter sp.]|uniref:hypothetical protein n=1 Tax=Rhodohalobacter sp. TaxID=1974210 RepID=UPI002ACEF95E|nr:hypothetical protein [Rhodohalobacter sp.]MDZ7756030.1 hypothetical protein [Rhodohalobacter sp.]
MPFSPQEPIPRKEKITVAYLVEKLRERVNIKIESCVAQNCSGDRYVVEADLHRPGLALAGYIELFTHQRIQIIGNTETQFLEHMGEDKQKEAFRNITQFDLPVIFLTDSNELPDYLLEICEKSGYPRLLHPAGDHRGLCTYCGILWKTNLPYKPWFMALWWMYMELEFW